MHCILLVLYNPLLYPMPYRALCSAACLLGVLWNGDHYVYRVQSSTHHSLRTIRDQRRVLLLSSNDGSPNFVPQLDALSPRDKSAGLQSPMAGILAATFYDVSDDVRMRSLCSSLNVVAFE